VEGAAVNGSCLPSPSSYTLRPCFFNAPGFRLPLSALRFQVSAFLLSASLPSVRIEFGYGEKPVAGLFDGVIHPEPAQSEFQNPFMEPPVRLTSTRARGSPCFDAARPIPLPRELQI
jgi:hypothetical protein